MKYYSEILDKTFDTEEELIKAGIKEKGVPATLDEIAAKIVAADKAYGEYCEKAVSMIDEIGNLLMECSDAGIDLDKLCDNLTASGCSEAVVKSAKLANVLDKLLS